MTHYQVRKELYDGDLVIFRRADAETPPEKRYWQARFKIAGRVGLITKSRSVTSGAASLGCFRAAAH